MIDTSDRARLFAIAREAIRLHFEGKTFSEPAELTPALERPAGAFVTLHKSGDLRGCIGTILPSGPLWRAVADNAVNAAFFDPRFAPVRREEYPELDLEISVMEPPVEVRGVAEIVVGRDGLIASRGFRKGLLLPQVATEYSWDRETFLAHTCMKAGLPQNAWREPDCQIERFAAEVFGEKDVLG